ncbi:hypothetical protein [Ovoidimarina sediminis]|uniref:hypothetical protein n=1 Tax=Ovoidimarina sediminis TaxID=3079856 RepID=UPI00290FBE2C|nr:hypothetical protein [Rhodophyticola sp. MJ-SS7]MDU8943607.1 hypothetical protein [Rhodophyticola sp. MJ-SS7]
MFDWAGDNPGLALLIAGCAAYVLGPMILGRYDPDTPRKWWDLRRVGRRKGRK